MVENEKDIINFKDVYETYWRCRDIEISNLWQRSVFLTAFLLGCFAAYGLIVPQLLELLSDVNNQAFLILNIVAFAVSLIGVVFSILWIKMGKGSKAWVEAYEKAIIASEKNDELANKAAQKYGGFAYHALPNYEGVEIKNKLLSQKAGEYSVSKINIGIGQIFLFVWLAIGITHSAIVTFSSFHKCIIPYTVIAVIVSYFAIYRFIGRKKAFKSGAIKYYRKND